MHVLLDTGRSTRCSVLGGDSSGSSSPMSDRVVQKKHTVPNNSFETCMAFDVG